MNISNIVNSALTFYSQIKSTPNGRYLSWEHCYSAFSEARNSNADIDKLCLHLSFYLASWGMYRGSSFLLQRDYLVHGDVVEEILSSDWDVLQNIRCESYLNPENVEKLFDLKKKLTELYNPIRKKVYDIDWKDIETKTLPDGDVSPTLISKILMGTLGCAPAYDRFFRYAIMSNHIASGNFNEKSILDLSKHYLNNINSYEKARAIMRLPNNEEYPQMKVLDMAFWQIGYEDDLLKRNQNTLIKNK